MGDTEQPPAPRLRFELVGYPPSTQIRATCPYCAHEWPLVLLLPRGGPLYPVCCPSCRLVSHLSAEAVRQWVTVYAQQQLWLASHQPYPGAL